MVDCPFFPCTDVLNLITLLMGTYTVFFIVSCKSRIANSISKLFFLNKAKETIKLILWKAHFLESHPYFLWLLLWFFFCLIWETWMSTFSSTIWTSPIVWELIFISNKLTYCWKYLTFEGHGLLSFFWVSGRFYRYSKNVCFLRRCTSVNF